MSDLMDKIQNGRQYRNMNCLEIRKKEENEADQDFKVKGYATTYNEPYVLCSFDDCEIREQVDPSAFDECDMSDVIMQYDHMGRVFARISNNTLSLTSDEHGLLIEADLGGTEIGRQLYEEIKGGYTSKMSFGFTVDDDKVEEFTEDDKRIYMRTITRIGKLYDVSAVSLPANDGTEISARTFVDGVIAKAESERIQKEAEERKNRMEELEKRIKRITLEVKINAD